MIGGQRPKTKKSYHSKAVPAAEAVTTRSFRPGLFAPPRPSPSIPAVVDPAVSVREQPYGDAAAAAAGGSASRSGRCKRPAAVIRGGGLSAVRTREA